VGGAAAWALVARRARADGGAIPALVNPFELKGALRFAAIYAVVLLVVEGAGRLVGTWGIVVDAVVAGLTDVDAITLSLATAPAGGLDPATATAGIALAALSNTVAKAAYAAWFGSGAFRRGMTLILGAAFAAGAVSLAVVSL
jgi:uncharacterized membrane protein (DUF4010 family)